MIGDIKMKYKSIKDMSITELENELKSRVDSYRKLLERITHIEIELGKRYDDAENI